MKTLKIARFKAFGTPFELNPMGRNMLIYGENGAGKSSIAEALRIVFHHERLFGRFARKGVSRDQEETRFLASYAHKGNMTEGKPEIMFDGLPYSELDKHNQHCAIITRDTIFAERRTYDDILEYKPDTINFRQLISSTDYAFWQTDGDIMTLEQLQEVIDEVNQVLDRRFLETLRIGIESEDMYINLTDKVSGLYASEDLHRYFNEAKINLASLLLLLVTIKREYASHAAQGSRPILVMDDVISSLDACNRSFFAEYLLDEFANYQLIVLTHNLGFNNTFVRIIDSKNQTDAWQCVTLYVRNDGPHAYEYNAFRRSADLLKDLDNGSADDTALTIEARRHFEALLIEFAKFTLLDARERANFHLKRLQKSDWPFFLCMHHGKIMYADDLLNDIRNVVNTDDAPYDKLSIIKEKLSSFVPSKEMLHAIAIIRRLNMYEKIFVHSVTHGGKPLNSVSPKELRAMIILLGELEQSLQYLRHEVG